MEISFSCSHVGPLRGPLKGVPVPAWAPPQATVPSGCPCSSVESFLPRVHLQLCLQQLFPSPCFSVPFWALCYMSPPVLSFAFAATGSFSLCHINWSGATVCSSDELEDGRQWVYGASWTGHGPHRAVYGLLSCISSYQNLHPVHSCASWVMLEEWSCPYLITGAPASFYTLRNKTKVLSCSLLNSSNNVLWLLDGSTFAIICINMSMSVHMWLHSYMFS